MKQSQFLRDVADASGLTQETVKAVFEATSSCILRNISGRFRTPLFGLGYLNIKTVRERKGFNPNSREEIIIPEHNKVTFTPSRIVKDTAKECEYIKVRIKSDGTYIQNGSEFEVKEGEVRTINRKNIGGLNALYETIY